MNLDWRGAKDSLGNQLYPGAERGTEEPVPLTAQNGFTGNLGLVWQQAGTEPAFDSLMFWALGRNWNWQDLFKATDRLANELTRRIAIVDNTKVGDSTFAGVLNANSTDLSAFAGHGGKMVMYAGYADPLIPSATAIDYYNAVATADLRISVITCACSWRRASGIAAAAQVPTRSAIFLELCRRSRSIRLTTSSAR